MTLWLQHSADDANPLQLAQQFGWQLPLCSMLNMAAAQGAHLTLALALALTLTLAVTLTLTRCCAGGRAAEGYAPPHRA